MWRLLEARLRLELPGTLALLVIVLWNSQLAVFFVSPDPVTPERMAAAFVLLAAPSLWVYRQMIRFKERKESRLALLATLPVPQRWIAMSQVLELLLVPGLVALTALVFGAFGRVWIGGPLDTTPLWLLASFAGFLLVVDQAWFAWEQIWLRRHGLWWRVVVWFALPVAAFLGLIVLQFGRWRQLEEFQGWGTFLAGLIVVTAALSFVNCRLFARRPDFIR